MTIEAEFSRERLKALNRKNAELRAASAASTSEAAVPSGAFGVTTGSLPVSSAKALIADWQQFVAIYTRYRDESDRAGQLDWKARYQNVLDAYDHCIAGLRRQVELATERQPEENNKASQRRT